MQKLLIFLSFTVCISISAFSQQKALPELPKIIKKQIIQPRPTDAQLLIQAFEFKIEKLQSFDYELYLRNSRSYKMHVLRHTT
ncbi:MAG TPA: hypothetical protein DCQ31_15855 [Bacteroidales bacterium]|nr:hypothetical protein [Bacteroidales bacterium]